MSGITCRGRVISAEIAPIGRSRISNLNLRTRCIFYMPIASITYMHLLQSSLFLPNFPQKNAHVFYNTVNFIFRVLLVNILIFVVILNYIVSSGWRVSLWRATSFVNYTKRISFLRLFAYLVFSFAASYFLKVHKLKRLAVESYGTCVGIVNIIIPFLRQ